MASLVTEHMESYGTKFLKRCFPTKVEKLESNRLQVTWKNTDLGTEETDSFDTVMWAVGKLDYLNVYLQCFPFWKWSPLIMFYGAKHSLSFFVINYLVT